MLFNIFRVNAEHSISESYDYMESVEAPDAESAIQLFAVKRFGAQSLFKPERWSHTKGRVYIGTRYENFYRAEPCLSCLQCPLLQCACNLLKK